MLLLSQRTTPPCFWMSRHIYRCSIATANWTHKKQKSTGCTTGSDVDQSLTHCDSAVASPNLMTEHATAGLEENICALVIGCKKPNKSDQTHSSVRPAYHFFLSAQRASEEGFIVKLWQFKAKLSLQLSWICFCNTHERKWYINFEMFSSNKDCELKNAEIGTTSLDELTVNGQKIFFHLTFLLSKGTSDSYKSIMEIVSQLPQASSEIQSSSYFLPFYDHFVKKNKLRQSEVVGFC